MGDRSWMRPDLDRGERVARLLCEMTLEEKIGQMQQVNRLDAEQAGVIRRGLVGSSLNASGPTAGNVRDEGVRAQGLNALQRVAVEESRLGIPILFARDVIHGHRTVFPIPLGQAATWEPGLAEEAAAVAAREAAADGLHWTFGPMVEVCRDPRWGRIAESPGEDPYLAARFAEAMVHGFQGDDLAAPDRLAACAKHYVGYSGAEGGRDYNTVTCGERTLRDVYMPPFKAAVEAGVATVMASFNEIDGEPVTASGRLLTEVLVKEWGFEGFVVSDWNAVAELCEHGVAADLAQATALACCAGVDMDMVADAYIQHAAEAVRRGAIPLERIDDAVRRILAIKFACGLFEHPYADEEVANRIMACPAHRDVALRVARESLVLLENDGILPLSPDKGRVLLTGPLAEATGELFGTWTLDGRPEEAVSVAQGLREALGPEATLIVDAHPGYADHATMAAREADVAVICVGEGPWRSGEARSTTTLDLPPGQRERIESLHRMGIPIVAVVFAGRPLSIGWLAEHANAVLYAWHPGTEGGHAIADVLLGAAGPGGRLPVTFPRNVGQVPIYYAHKPTGRPLPLQDRHMGRYVDSLDSPLYPFGYGLDYTTFAYSDLRVTPQSAAVGESVTVTTKVTNTGARRGKAVVQLYVRDLVGSVTRPVKELAGFQAVRLAPGESAAVRFTLDADALSFTRLDGTRGVEPGAFRVWVGPHSDEGLEGSFVLTP